MIRIGLAILASVSAAWRCRRGLLIRVMDCATYNWAMRWIVPRIRFTWHHAKLPHDVMMCGFHRLKPGDIILTSSRWQLTSMCIPGELTHAAICVRRISIAEMVAAGFRWNWFRDVCCASRAVILRCTDWDEEYTQRVIAKCKTFEGTPYDAGFTFGLRSLYCSELIYHSDVEKRAKVNTGDLMGLGREYVSPMAYYNAPNMEVIFDSDLEVQ